MKAICRFVFALVFGAPAFACAKNIELLRVDVPFGGSKLFVPNDGKAHKGLVMLHGSEGGSLPFAHIEAQFLAASGYAVLAFCWYNCSRDPITSPLDPLERVELRRTIDAIRWLKNSEYVQGGKIALLGWSRGGEQAVLLGSFDESARLVDAIAVHTPSDTVVGGFSWTASDKRCWICSSFDLACFNSSEDPARWDWVNTRWNPSCGPRPKLPGQTQAWLLDGAPVQMGKTIEIEKFGKPVFITVGDQDELWDYRKSVRIKERLERSGRPVELHVFPGEHHIFSTANENKRHQFLIDFLEGALGK